MVGYTEAWGGYHRGEYEKILGSSSAMRRSGEYLLENNCIRKETYESLERALMKLNESAMKKDREATGKAIWEVYDVKEGILNETTDICLKRLKGFT